MRIIAVARMLVSSVYGKYREVRNHDHFQWCAIGFVSIIILIIAISNISGLNQLLIMLNILINMRQTCVFKRNLDGRNGEHLSAIDIILTVIFAVVMFLPTSIFLFLPEFPACFVVGYQLPEVTTAQFLTVFCNLYSLINFLIILWVKIVTYGW